MTESLSKIESISKTESLDRSENTIVSMIIAAGYSSRMHAFKPLLPFGEQTVIEKVIDTHKKAGVQKIYVVIGHRGDEVYNHIKAYDVTCVWNKNYEQGMFSSIVAGVRQIVEDTLELNKDTAFFMHPVDIPCVKVETLKRLIHEFQLKEHRILYPSFRGKKGHPPLIDLSLSEALLTYDGDGGLKKFLQSYENEASYVTVFDEMILRDMDVKEDYDELLLLPQTLNRAECMELLSYYHVSDEVIAHSEKVAETVATIVHRLTPFDVVIDKDELNAAALLHDIARHEINHALVGANILRALGYGEIAEMVLTHMSLERSGSEVLSAAEVLYLADKLVERDQSISLERRFIHRIESIKQSDEGKEKALKRYHVAKKIVEKIERIIGEEFIL